LANETDNLKVTFEIPERYVDRLISATEGNDPELGEYLKVPLPLNVRALHESRTESELVHRGKPVCVIENICRRFHLVAKKMQERHEGRPTLEIEDEYDVQDLLHALMTLYFDDIRPEEWTPSYAGGSSRMDFLLKQEQVVVEVKKTRKGLGARKVGEELMIDIQRYKAHPNCKSLFCFVYDPEGRISSPKGIENDLNKTYDGLPVKVLIAPRKACFHYTGRG
jgi:hypothetical protein